MNMVKFKKVNLMQDFSANGKFNLILCRNVLIYFDRETKSDIVNRMHPMINDGGYLVIGASESLMNVSDNYTPIIGKGGMFKKD